MTLTRLLTGAALALGLATTAVAQDKTKVGFIYVGPIGDGGWTYEHDKGRLALEEHFGDKVETVYQESVPEGADAERAITQMALQGADLIFTTSFGYMDPTVNVAGKFPDVMFEHATGYKTADNVSTYSARFYEGRAVQGHIAGKMTESNVIGYIASFPIPEVIRGINAAYIHAKKVNPDVQFKIIWAYTWFDPAKEADAATALIEQGADVILQHTDSTAPASRRREGWQRDHLRAGLGHGRVQAQAAGELDHRQLGALLYRAHAGGDGRHVGDQADMGRDRPGHGRDRRDHGCRAGRGEGRGAGHEGCDGQWRIPPLHRPAEEAGRL